MPASRGLYSDRLAIAVARHDVPFCEALVVSSYAESSPQPVASWEPWIWFGLPSMQLEHRGYVSPFRCRLHDHDVVRRVRCP